LKTKKDYHDLAESIGWRWIGKSPPDRTEKRTKWLCRAGHEQYKPFKTVKDQGDQCKKCTDELRNEPDYVDPRSSVAEDYHTLAKQKGWKWVGKKVPKNVTTKTTWETDHDHKVRRSYNSVQASLSAKSFRPDYKSAYGKRMGLKPPPEESYAVTHPEIASQWHPTKNGEKTPFDVTHGSGEDIWWVCPKSKLHDYQFKVVERTRGYNCPFCHGSRVAPDTCLTYKFPEIAAEWHPKKNGNLKPEDVTASYSKKVHWFCPIHPDAEWYVSPNQRTSREEGRGCPGCAKTGFDPTREGRLYYIRVYDRVFGTLYKIGITNHSVSRRFLPYELEKITIVAHWYFTEGHRAHRKEGEILRLFEQSRYKGENVLLAGNTELFIKDVLGLDPQSGEQKHPIVQDILKEAAEIPIYLDD